MTHTTNTPAPVTDLDNRAAFDADMHLINRGACRPVLDMYWVSTEGKLWRAALARRAGMAKAATIAADMLAELDIAKLPLAVAAAIGVLRTALGDTPSVSHSRQVNFVQVISSPDFLRADLGDRRFWPVDADIPSAANVEGQAVLQYRKRGLNGWHDAEPGDGSAHLDPAFFELRTLCSAPATSAAALDVLAERRRQVEQEGWTPEHDDEHGAGEMAEAAACYITGRMEWSVRDQHQRWPWAHDWWKPHDKRRNLVKAGALILAEIERMDRLEDDLLSGTQKGGSHEDK